MKVSLKNMQKTYEYEKIYVRFDGEIYKIFFLETIDLI
jgi:hypothetical protein